MNFVCMVGLPRSGGTLLSSILAQNPRVAAGSSSGLVHLISKVANSWNKIPAFTAHGIEDSEARIASALRGMIAGFYKDEIDFGKVVIDKNRDWLIHRDILERLLPSIPIIVTVRDVVQVASSFERRFRDYPMYHSPAIDDPYYGLPTTDQRTRFLLSPSGLIGRNIQMVGELWRRRDSRFKVITIRYDALVNDPEGALAYIAHNAGIPSFKYDFENVRSIGGDDWAFGWGPGLHEVRPVVAIQDRPPVLDRETIEWIRSTFPGFCFDRRGS